MTPWETYFDSLTEDQLRDGAICPRCGETVAMHAYAELRVCADRYNLARFTR